MNKLAPGKYTFSISDRSATSSFDLLGPKTRRRSDLTTGALRRPRSTATVDLTKGRWTFLSGLAQIHFFPVGS